MTKWRKTVRTAYNPYRELYNFVFKLIYCFDLKKFFKQWKINIQFKDKVINLIYTKPFVEFSQEIRLNANNREEKDRIIYAIQEFILNAYYLYERDWKPMKYKDLAWLLLVSPQAVDNEIRQEMQKVAQRAKEQWIIVDWVNTD